MHIRFLPCITRSPLTVLELDPYVLPDETAMQTHLRLSIVEGQLVGGVSWEAGDNIFSRKRHDAFARFASRNTLKSH